MNGMRKYYLRRIHRFDCNTIVSLKILLEDKVPSKQLVSIEKYIMHVFIFKLLVFEIQTIHALFL